MKAGWIMAAISERKETAACFVHGGIAHLVQMLTCHKVTHKNLTDGSPLFRDMREIRWRSS